MAEKRSHFRNNDASPGLKMPVPSVLLKVHELGSGLKLYKLENGPNNRKLYVKYLDKVIDVSELFENETLPPEYTEFQVEISEEEDSDIQVLPTPDKRMKGKRIESDIHYDYKERYKKKKRKRHRSRSQSRTRSRFRGRSRNRSRSRSQNRSRDRSRGRSRSSSCSISPVSKKDKKIKIEPPQFGTYVCEVCDVKMTCEQAYESHISGRKHLKALRFQDLPATVLKTIPRTVAESKYTLAASRIRRVSSREKASIQNVVERKIRKPLIALHKVIEIQGLSETRYYCTLCDTQLDCNSIFSHLNGYRHRLYCLKYLDPKIYHKNKYASKSVFAPRLNSILKREQEETGMGKISVEKEISKDADRCHLGRRDMYQPSTSSMRDPRSSPSINFDETSVRDFNKSGYYCKICHAPNNNISMWESHLSGKRHLANMKKHPGCVPSKMKSIPLPNKPSMLVRSLMYEYQPIVGLDNIIEIQNDEIGLEKYQCLLCSASFTRLDIRDHLVTDKHMRNYLRQINHEDCELFDEDFPDGNMHNLLVQICARVKREQGSGHPEVRVTKDTLKL